MRGRLNFSRVFSFMCSKVIRPNNETQGKISPNNKPHGADLVGEYERALGVVGGVCCDSAD